MMFQCNRCGESFSKYRTLYLHKEFEDWVNAGGDAFGNHAKVTTVASTDSEPSKDLPEHSKSGSPISRKGQT